MKRLFIAAIALVSWVALRSPARADDVQVSGHVNLFLGAKLLNSDWDIPGYDVSNQIEAAALLDGRPQGWPVHVALDFLVSGATKENEGIEVKGHTNEIAVGLRKYFMEGGTVHPYLGGGVAFLRATQTLVVDFFGLKLTDEESHSAVGPWLGLGVAFNPHGRLNLGIDGRYSYGKASFPGGKVQAGGYHIGAFIGFFYGNSPV